MTETSTIATEIRQQAGGREGTEQDVALGMIRSLAKSEYLDDGTARWRILAVLEALDLVRKDKR